MKHLFIFTWISFYFLNMNAQVSPIELKADVMYNKFDFKSAIKKYEEVGLENLSTKGLRNLSNAYLKTHNDTMAENRFKALIEKEDHTSEDVFHYAEVLQMNGKQAQSDEWLEKFYALIDTDAYTTKRGSKAELKNDIRGTKIEHLSINTEQEDFGPAYHGDKIVFASSRPHKLANKSKWSWNKLPYLNIYDASIDSGSLQLTNPQMLSKQINKKFHEGPASFSKDGSLMVYTRNNYEDIPENKAVKLKMFYTTKDENGKWLDPIGFDFNNKSYSVGHPSVSEDGKTIYFSSDMPGGKGKADIYKINKTDSGWSAPINLGSEINTELDEMFPFIHPNHILFFASKGHVGLGGLDIYASRVKKNEYSKPNNLRHPINGHKDDFGLILDKDQRSGYFSSNRPGGKGADDLYAFTMQKGFVFCKDVEGVVQTDQGELLPGKKVIIVDENGDVVSSVVVGDDAKYKFCLDEGDYKFKLLDPEQVVLDHRYNPSDVGLDFTVDLFDEKPLVINHLYKTQKTEPIEQVEINTKGDNISGLTVKNTDDKGNVTKEIIEINNIYFDLNKSFIRKDAAKELNKIVRIMNAYPDIEIEIGSHTDCRASKSYNKALSSRRATSSMNYIKKRITKPSRITGKGYGEDKLLVDCPCEGSVKSDCSEAKHQKNRRTEFKILNIGKAYIINKSSNSFGK